VKQHKPLEGRSRRKLWPSQHVW